ncbi:MAG: phBC6A51 family helix-turn-helix protein [bacterium]|jgi:DNA-binding XRE family transcriptional regulator
MKQKQLDVIKMMVKGSMTQGEIAKAAGVNQATICRWKKDPVFLLEYSRQVKESLTRKTPGSFRALVDFLKARKEMAKSGEYEIFFAAEAILDGSDTLVDCQLRNENVQHGS